jgi:cell pole-organizing protein PopZ
MSAANASATSQSFQDEARANEPSMEEILASIRRIIADDDGLPGVRHDDRRRARTIDTAPATRRAYPAPVLERRQDEPPLSEARAGDGEIDDAGEVRLLYIAEDGEQEAEMRPPEVEDALESEGVAYKENAGVEVFDEAPGQENPSAATIAPQLQALVEGAAFSDALDRCAVEMLRPVVQEWFDENLPALVERLVRAEVERITRAGSSFTASGAKSIQP